MPECISEIFTDADTERLRKKIKLWIIALCIAAAAALAVCSVLAATVTTANAESSEFRTIIISTLSGWVIIYCAVFVVGSARRELAHSKTLSEGERERFEGKVTVTRERLRIKKSVCARGVEVETPSGTVHFWVVESKAAKLKDARAVYAVHGYVAAYEVAK